jgi:hypothetical protein
LKKTGIWVAAFALTVAANLLWVYRDRLPPAETLLGNRVVVRPVALPPDLEERDPVYLGGWQGYDLYLPRKGGAVGAARFELVETTPGLKEGVVAKNDVQFYRKDRLRIVFRLRQPETETVAALRRAYPNLPKPDTRLCLLDLHVSGSPGSFSQQTHLIRAGKPNGRAPGYTVSNLDDRQRVRTFGSDEPVTLHEFSLGVSDGGPIERERDFILRVRTLPTGRVDPKNVFSGVTL